MAGGVSWAGEEGLLEPEQEQKTGRGEGAWAESQHLGSPQKESKQKAVQLGFGGSLSPFFSWLVLLLY